ncbi:TfoX/Sxy family protein [Microbacterium sp. BK668]|uniref:TfoX/Sxy family protein n=1 Tax=Microbacterium sp. BK668 TaxID=2512118 RepID=UPI00105C4885|nr:TfoX/Sxy family protein [Microbacterium sp. BK668]TDN90947.1 TfoX-like protein [Microbacterium sp. BK668]
MKDEAAQQRAHAIFDPIARPYLGRPDVDIGPMFGSEGLRVRGKVFAFVGHRGSLVVKVPEERADEIVASGVAERMEMRGRAMREWLVVGPGAAAEWQPLTAEAFAYVDEITP